MKVVADTLGVARSNLVEQMSGASNCRSRYQRQGDDAVLAAIRQFTGARPTYGYRRITALLNRTRRASGAEPTNHKRVFRLMAQGQLLYFNRMSVVALSMSMRGASSPWRPINAGLLTA